MPILCFLFYCSSTWSYIKLKQRKVLLQNGQPNVKYIDNFLLDLERSMDWGGLLAHPLFRRPPGDYDPVAADQQQSTLRIRASARDVRRRRRGWAAGQRRLWYQGPHEPSLAPPHSQVTLDRRRPEVAWGEHNKRSCSTYPGLGRGACHHQIRSLQDAVNRFSSF